MVGLNHLKDTKDQILKWYAGCLQNYWRVQSGKKKVQIVFDTMMTDMINNKKRHPVVTELFVKGKKTLCTFS